MCKSFHTNFIFAVDFLFFLPTAIINKIEFYIEKDVFKIEFVFFNF